MPDPVTLPEWPKKPWSEHPGDYYGRKTWYGFDISKLDAFDAEVAKIQAERDAIVKADEDRFAAIVEAVKALGAKATGSRSTGRRKRNGMPEYEDFRLETALRMFFPAGYRDEFRVFGNRKPDTTAERKFLAEKDRVEADAKRAADLKAAADGLATRAVAWLMARGKVLGTDFTVGTALGVANDIAAEEYKAKQNGDPIPFDGDDNCENCAGWSPGSHRCECGNRRVSWSTHDGHTFESPCVYPEAY